jgi:hypothetical protein
VIDWVREDPTIGPAELISKLSKNLYVVIPYHRVFDGKEMALDLMQGKWDDHFHMLCSFKDEVKKISRAGRI